MVKILDKLYCRRVLDNMDSPDATLPIPVVPTIRFYFCDSFFRNRYDYRLALNVYGLLHYKTD